MIFILFLYKNIEHSEHAKYTMKIESFVLSLVTRPDRLTGFIDSVSKYKYYDPTPLVSDVDPCSPVLACTESHVEALRFGQASKK